MVTPTVKPQNSGDNYDVVDYDDNNNNNNTEQQVNDLNPIHATTAATTTTSCSPPTATAADTTTTSALSTQQKLFLFFAGASIFLYGGAFFGWGPMQLLLEENGNYASKCSNTNSTGVVCEEQTAALLNVRFYSQLTLFLSPLLGIISDRYGATTTCLGIATSTILGIGCLVIATSSSLSLDWMLYLAFCGIGLGSAGYGMLTVETGVVFQQQDDNDNDKNDSSNSSSDPNTNKLQSRIISAMNALYDASAVTYWGLWGISELMPNGIPLSRLVAGYLFLAVFCLGGHWYLFRSMKHQTIQQQQRQQTLPEKQKQTTQQQIESSMHKDNTELTGAKSSELEGSENDDSPVSLPMETSAKKYETIDPVNSTIHVMPVKTDETVPDVSNAADTSRPGSAQTAAEQSESYHLVHTTPKNQDDSKKKEHDHNGYIKIADRPFGQQMKSQLFIMLTIFFCFHQTSNIWTLTTARDFLKYLGDDDYGNRYLTIFTLLTPVSLLGLPFVDVAIHKYGFHVALQGVNGLAILHGTIKVAFANLNVQIVGFVVFSFFRCFLFSVSLSCLPTFVSSDATGRAVSILYCISGAMCFLNIPFASLALEQGDGNFFLPNLLYLLMTIPMILVTYQIGKGLKRDAAINPVDE